MYTTNKILDYVNDNKLDIQTVQNKVKSLLKMIKDNLADVDDADQLNRYGILSKQNMMLTILTFLLGNREMQDMPAYDIIVNDYIGLLVNKNRINVLLDNNYGKVNENFRNILEKFYFQTAYEYCVKNKRNIFSIMNSNKMFYYLAKFEYKPSLVFTSDVFNHSVVDYFGDETVALFNKHKVKELKEAKDSIINRILFINKYKLLNFNRTHNQRLTETYGCISKRCKPRMPNDAEKEKWFIKLMNAKDDIDWEIKFGWSLI